MAGRHALASKLDLLKTHHGHSKNLARRCCLKTCNDDDYDRALSVFKLDDALQSNDRHLSIL
jgi:hypothetical protein